MQPALDGFTVRRKGDGNTKIRIVLHLEQQPEQYKVHPDLGMSFLCLTCPRELFSKVLFVGNILGLKEESRTGVIQALWNYIKSQDLQDKADRRKVHPDAALAPVCILSPATQACSSPLTHGRYLAGTKVGISDNSQNSSTGISSPLILSYCTTS